jgi:hypothetical protein
MASLRKKYQDRVESPDEPPVASTPRSVEVPSAVAANAAPVDEKSSDDRKPSPTDVDPVREAERTALKQRLAEMERAEGMVREAVQQQPLAIENEPQQQPQTAEQIIASSGLPERAQAWLRRHPDYVTDPQKNAHIQGLHYAAAHQAGGDAFSDLYFSKLENLLGLKQAQSNGNGTYQSAPPSVQRQAAPVRQQRTAGGPLMSAPPTREVPSMSTGRPTNVRRPLTQAQRDIAKNCGISDEKYQEQLEIMERQKAAGMHQDGR